MHNISLDMETLTARSFATAPRNNRDPSYLTPIRPRRPLRALRMLLVSAGAVMATACATLSAPADVAAGPTRAELDAATAEAATAQAAAQAAQDALGEAQAATAAAQADAAQARAEADAARQDAAQARGEASQARAAQSEAMAKVDAMMMAAHHPSEVMVSADLLDVDLLDLGAAQASLAGPDSIYVSSIRYAGETYSALLKYQGGTTATVAGVFGRDGKLIPDSVELGMTELAFLAPNRLVVSNVEVGGVGYSGELQYVGGNRLQVAGIRRVTLPPTPAARIAALEAELAAAEAAANAAMADAEAAMADAEAAMADADAARADADAMMDKMMMADALHPAEVMVSADMLDASLANVDQVQVSLAGPDSVYLSNIMYDGVPYSALLKYQGGTTATVEAVYGPMGKLIPDSVGLSQTSVDFMAPAALAVSNVEVGGVGYSGTLEYAGGNKLRVTNIRQVTLPPTAAEAAAAAIAQAEADAAAAMSAAQAEADAAMADADAARAEADSAMADADAAQAAAAASAADADAAQAKLDAMMADSYQPSQVMVSADMLDASLANLDQAQVSLAGPDSVYLSNIMYDGVPYSALLRYTGGTSATVEAVYGPMGKLIPDSVGLSQTTLDFMAPAALAVSNVEVGGAGYSGTLEYAGGDQLRVTNIRRVTLPQTAAEMAQAENESLMATIAEQSDRIAALEAALAEAQAEASAANSAAGAASDDAAAAMADTEAAQAAAEAAQAKLDAMMADAYQPSRVMVSADMLDASLANLDQVQVSLAGPDSIYLSNIMYDGVPYSALLRYTGGTSATVEAVYGPMGKLIPDSVGLSQTTLDFVAPAALAVSNVEVGGAGYSGTLEYAGGDQLRVTNIRRVTLPPTAAEAAQTAAEAAIAKAEADAEAAMSAAQAEADAAMADADAARAEADNAMADAQAAQAAAAAAAADAEAAQAKLDAMMADAYQPSQVMVSADMLDPSLANLDQVRVSLAGPDAVYLSNIMYDGVPYSALLRYTGGTSATVEAVYGPMGKLIPDSVGLSQTTLDFVAPAALAVSNVEVGGAGYSGTLEYAGGDQLRVTNIRRVTLPQTAAEMAQAAADAAMATAAAEAAAAMSAAQAEAGAALADADAALAKADAALADADAARAAAAASAADAAAAQAKLDAMMADAYQPSQVMVSADMLDPSLANLDRVQVSLAGPDAVYLSNIMYDGVPYSALLRYTGGTSATVEAVYGPMGKLIPDSVGLSRTTVDFMAPAAVAVSNVEVGGVGYSGTLEYAGGDQLRVTNIRRVTLPATAAEAAQAAAQAAIAQAEADAAAAVSAADAAADAARADADEAMAMADAAMADAQAAQAAAAASAADAAAAQAKLDAMMADAYQPSEVMVSADLLDPSLANLDRVQVSLAGPDTVYLSNIMYDGVPYSALLRYGGGTSATVEAVYGPMGKLLPDSVGLAQTTVDFMAPASLAVSNVEVDGVGYAGTLEYAGGNKLRVINVRRVTLPPTAAEAAQAAAQAAIAQARADAEAAVNAAMADADAAKDQADTAMAETDAALDALSVADARNAELAARAAELAAQVARLTEGVPLAGINPGLLDLESARLTVAGPNSIYISGIQYGGEDVSARVRYEQGTGRAEALFGAADNLIAESVDMDAAEIELVGDSLMLSNVGIKGIAHTLTLTFNDEGGIDVSAHSDGWPVRTAAELRRDKLITEGSYLVNGFAGGRALAGEGSWSESGATVTQTDAGASHAKYTIPADQSASEMLFGVTASAAGSDKVGFGLHLLASDTPETGNTWNYGRSYLIWATRDPFYDTDDTHLQFYESSDDNKLTWLASRRIDQPLTSPLTLEALYHSNGVMTLLVSGEEQLSLDTGSTITEGDHIALRSLGGPVEFTQVYVTAR